MTTSDPRAQQLAEARYRNGFGPTLAEPWGDLLPATREFLISEAANWTAAAVAAGLMPAAQGETPIADADNPTHLGWGLDDVLWGDDDTVIVLLSGPDREPYWLELDPERAAVLRRNLAGPDGEQADAEEDATILAELQQHLAEHTPSCNARTDHLMQRAAWALGAVRPAHAGGNAED